MEIKKENKFKRNFKKIAVLSVACLFCVGIALTIAFAVPGHEQVPVSNSGISFTLPMQNAVVVKDYEEDKLQKNESLNRWEIHLAVDLASENANVFAVSDGVVASVDSNSLDGYIITINHSDGYQSVYSSLSDKVKVKEGDKVSKGQQIGEASNSAANESKAGAHLHLVMLKDGLEVDPNNYLDLQNK